MSPWVDPETGEAGDCPVCLGQDAQVAKMEGELRAMRGKVTRAERTLEKDVIAKRDGALWKQVLTHWRTVFPDKRPSATGIRSARATAFFLRIESGATVEEVCWAIDGGKVYPYLVYGKRVGSGSRTALADDLQEIMSLKNDANFDFLRDTGKAMAT